MIQHTTAPLPYMWRPSLSRFHSHAASDNCHQSQISSRGPKANAKQLLSTSIMPKTRQRNVINHFYMRRREKKVRANNKQPRDPISIQSQRLVSGRKSAKGRKSGGQINRKSIRVKTAGGSQRRNEKDPRQTDNE